MKISPQYYLYIPIVIFLLTGILFTVDNYEIFGSTSDNPSQNTSKLLLDARTASLFLQNDTAIIVIENITFGDSGNKTLTNETLRDLQSTDLITSKIIPTKCTISEDEITCPKPNSGPWGPKHPPLGPHNPCDDPTGLSCPPRSGPFQ